MTTQMRRMGAAVALAAIAMVLTGTPASAHVLLAKAQPNGNGTTTLTFTFDHGCGAAPTTELTVSLPSGVTAVATVATTQPAGWAAQTTTSQVKWNGPGITPGNQTEFAVVTRIVGTVGQTFQFPTVQRCDNGASYDWKDPQPSDEHPAPTMIATRAVLAEQPPPVLPAATPSETGASLTHTLGAIVVFTAAAAALGRVLTRPKPPNATP